MICPICKSRFRRTAGRQLLTAAGRQPQPIEMILSDAPVCTQGGVELELKGYSVHVLLCPCGHPLMAAIYHWPESDSDDYRPTVLQEGGP